MIVRDMDRYVDPNPAKLLDSDDILKISYCVRRARYPAYTSLSLALEDQEPEMDVLVNGSMYRIAYL